MSEVVETIGAARLLPVVVLNDAAQAAPLGAALFEGGLRSVEVTFRTDAAEESIRTLTKDPALLVGAGTVLTVDQVNRAVDAGARFVVSPGFSQAVVRRCQDLGLPVFPGVATATEIQMALDAGLDTVKFFPAEQLGGAKMVRALAAPYRSLRFIPTGGVTSANLRDYLAIPAVMAVGGTWMVAADLLRAGKWDEVTRLSAQAVAVAAGNAGQSGQTGNAGNPGTAGTAAQAGIAGQNGQATGSPIAGVR